MIKKNILASALLVAGSLPLVAFAGTQQVTPSQTSFTVASGSTVSFDVVYDASSPQNTTGFGVQLYFDSSKLSFTGATNTFTTGIAGSVSAAADGTDGDSDSSTDQKVTAGWFDLSGNWPNASSGTILYTATFTATGDTTVNFTGDAAAGHTFAATPVTVTMIVPDTTAPVVTAPADITMEATGPTTPVTLGTGAATDNIDGALTPAPDNAGPFAVGVHTITWTATDAATNSGTDTQTVTITDTTAPTVTASPITVTTTTANLPFAVAITATANDLVDGSITPIASNTGPFPAGATTVTWSATDAHNNTGTADQIVTVLIDDTPPTITGPASVTVPQGNTNTSLFGLNLSDGTVSPDQNIQSLAPGTYHIIWTATDSLGNTSTFGQDVTVEAYVAPTEVPTLSEWGIILLTFMLAFASLVTTRRRKEED